MFLRLRRPVRAAGDPFSEADREFPDYGVAYFRCLMTEYHALAIQRADPQNQVVAAAIEKLVKNLQEQEKTSSPDWSDLGPLEILLLRLLPDEVIGRRAWLVRKKYRDIAGPIEYATYVESRPPQIAAPETADAMKDAANELKVAAITLKNAAFTLQGANAPETRPEDGQTAAEPASTALLRADLESLLREIHFQYHLTNQREMVLAEMTRRISYLIGAFAFTTLIVVIYYVSITLPGASRRPIGGASTDFHLTFAQGQNSVEIQVPNRRSGGSMGSTSATSAVAASQGRSSKGMTTAQSDTSTGASGTLPEMKKSPDEPSALSTDEPSLALPLFAMVALMGAIGACVSVHRRMPSTQAYGGSLVGLIQLRNGKLGVCLSPVFGAVFAAILMMVFSGQLIHGSLFPEFTAERKDEGWTFISFLYWWKPTQATDVAKVLVWAFLAGFAEQFVPDVLDRLLAQSEETPKTSPPLG